MRVNILPDMEMLWVIYHAKIPSLVDVLVTRICSFGTQNFRFRSPILAKIFRSKKCNHWRPIRKWVPPIWEFPIHSMSCNHKKLNGQFALKLRGISLLLRYGSAETHNHWWQSLCLEFALKSKQYNLQRLLLQCVWQSLESARWSRSCNYKKRNHQWMSLILEFPLLSKMCSLQRPRL